MGTQLNTSMRCQHQQHTHRHRHSYSSSYSTSADSAEVHSSLRPSLKRRAGSDPIPETREGSMDPDPSKTSLDLGDFKRSSSPVRKMTEKSNVLGRMLSRTKLGQPKLPSFDESFDMVTDFDGPERKRTRADPFLSSHPSHPPASPSRRPPVAFKMPSLPNFSKTSLAPRAEARPPSPALPDPAHIPLPLSPSKRPARTLRIKQEHAYRPDQEPPTSASSCSTDAITTTSSSSTSSAGPAPSLPVKDESPLKAHIYEEFDRLFADFPEPPTHLRAPHEAGPSRIPGTSRSHLIPTPALSNGSSEYSSRPHTPLTPHAPPPDPARLESAINTLSQVIRALQTTQGDQATYIVRQADLEARLSALDKELGEVRAENIQLEVALRREREERARIEAEAQRSVGGMAREIHQLEVEKANILSSLEATQAAASASATQVQSLQTHLQAASTHSESQQTHIRELEAEVTRLTGAFDIVKSDYARKEDELRRRMEEAEFMHRALKESGARLGRELEVQRKRVSELEKKRGGYV